VKPGRDDGLASSIDLFPTMLAALGISAEKPLPGVNLLDERAVAGRKHVFGECFTVRSLALNDPAANLLWRWATDGKWELIVPRTYQATGVLATIPQDAYLGRDLRRTLVAAQPMLFDLPADPYEANDLAASHPEMVEAMMHGLDALWKPKLRSVQAQSGRP
jgi:uncharacterized sulfatase